MTGKRMDWIDVNDELPKSAKRYLARCINGDNEYSWSGIIDVYFNPNTGWSRCESHSKIPVFVTHYAEHPCPEYPFEENNDR